MISRFLIYLLGDKFAENNIGLLRVNYILIIFMYIFSAIMLLFLPKDMPMQWGADGSVNYTLPSIIGVWVAPTIMLLVNLSLKKREKINMINTGVYAFVTFIYVFIYVKIL